jgi:predicted site-specific integrase-resolvase
MPTAPATTQEWVTYGVAARRLGIATNTLRKLAESGRITVRALPGSWPRVPVAELDEIIQSSTRPRSTQS